MEIVDQAKKNLPENTTHGFAVVDDDGNAMMFFSWHDVGSITDGDSQIPVTSFSDVIGVLPRRMKEMGVNRKEAGALLREVKSKYGS